MRCPLSSPLARGLQAFVMYAREVLQQRWGVQELAGEEAPAPELAD